MKKFLFTLAALLLAGSLCAEDYLYISDFEVKQDELGSTIQVPVKAHFDAYVSAWDMYLTLPEGITVSAWEEGDDLLAIPYVNQSGKSRTLEGSVTTTDKLHYIAITSALTSDHYQVDGEWVPAGCVKWAPGEYVDGMLLITFNIAADFKGGNIVVATEPACGTDKRPEVAANLCPTNADGSIKHYEKTCVVTVEQTAQAAPEPTIEMDENYKVTAVVYDEEGNVVERDVKLYTVELDEEGNEVEGTRQEVTNPYNVTQTYQEQKISFVAVTPKVDGESEDTECEPKTFTISAKEKKAVEAPVINYETYDTEVVVTISWPTSDGNQVYTGEYTYPRTNVDQSFVVEAYVTEGETCQESAHATETIPVPKKEVIAKPTITFSGEETTTMTVTVSCETPGVTLYVNGAAVEGNPYSYTVTRADVYTAGTVEVTAVAKKGELESETAEESKDWVVKDKPKAPEATKTEDVTDTQVTVNFTPAEGTDTEVSVKVGDETVTLPYVINRPAYGEEPITVTFEVTVTGDNYTTNTYNVVVTVQPQDPTYASKPKITFTPNATGVNVKIENYTEYTIEVNGELVDKAPNRAGTGSFDVEKGDVNKTIVAYAKNAPENMIEADTTATYLLTAKKVYEVADPTISVDNSDPTKTVITIKATEGDLTYTLTDEDGNVIPASDYTVAATENEVVITIENGEEVKTVEVTATTTLTEAPEGYDEVKNGEAKKTVQTPVYVQPQTAKPTIDVSFAGEEGHYYANVTFKNGKADPNAVIEYCLGDPTVEDNWMTYTGAPVVITEDGSHTVYARATATGKATSEVADRTFELNQTATSVNELVNGKTVAGVRYFNMAGQEMQEANGITIVVTTYTDGTTSAVKVIK